MESTVSGTDTQEGRHDTQPSTTSQAKIDTNLIETSRRPFIYTPAQLHERDNEYDFSRACFIPRNLNNNLPNSFFKILPEIIKFLDRFSVNQIFLFLSWNRGWNEPKCV